MRSEEFAYLGLGSNVGDRLANLQKACDQLEESTDLRIIACSSIYKTEPVGELLAQRDFYNSAVMIETALGPLELLDLCKRIEKRLGRENGTHHGPRPIDIDILHYVGKEGIFKAGGREVVLPHPEIYKRRFVLVPLVEIDAEINHSSGSTLEQSLDRLPPGQRVERVAGPEAFSKYTQ